jgi:polysaccharide deacetylase family protein (PEP-CTERM system associated)
VQPLGSLERPAPGAPSCALTVDVEDWYQSCIDFDAPISERVVRNTNALLDVLDENATKATFFVQGLVAEAYPRLVSELVSSGHEVQSHAHTHRPLSRMSAAAVRSEIARGKAAIEDAAAVEVTAFRAPDFSVGSGNLDVLDAVAESGFLLDSSIFPLQTRRYGIAGWELGPHRIRLTSGGELLEVPVAVWARGRLRIPVAGGGYVRLAPRIVLERCLRGIVAEGRPPVVYCHPYEFSTRELDDYRGRVPERFRRSQGLGREAFVHRLRELLRNLPFGRLDDVLAAWHVTSSERSRPLVARERLDDRSTDA